MHLHPCGSSQLLSMMTEGTDRVQNYKLHRRNDILWLDAMKRLFSIEEILDIYCFLIIYFSSLQIFSPGECKAIQ